MKLIIFRHGEAGQSRTDFERCLTSRGHQQVAAMSQAKHSELDQVQAFASPYVRAQQTLSEIAQHCPLSQQHTLPIITPDDSPEAVIQWLSEQDESSFPLLLVSHQPMVSRLISLLVKGDYQGYYPMSTASMAVLEADVWAKGLAELISLNHADELV